MMDLPTCPRAGGGVHRWLLGASNKIARSGVSQSAAVEILSAESRGCGRVVTQRELADAVRKAFSEVVNIVPRVAPSATKPTKAKPIPERIARITATDFGAVELWEASPVRLTDDAPDAEELVDLLFPGDPLLCCGADAHTFDTKPREEWRGHLRDLALIVPSPMSAPTGLTQDGKTSARSNANVGPRKYLVIEFDQGSFDDHAARLWHLADMGPLVLVVHSGGKSLHGWFRCAGASDQKLNAFMRYAVSIGADPATWTVSQMVRMPEGTRQDGRRQRVMYFNKEILP